VNDLNVIHLAAQTFFCDTGKLNELSVRRQRWRLRRNANMQRGAPKELTQLEDLLLQSISYGTGIDFIDKILDKNRKGTSELALEIVGRTKTAKTKLLMMLAANYAAATSVSCMGPIPNSKEDEAHEKKNAFAPIVIFDPEYSLDFEELVGTVRIAVLRRWNATTEFRQCLKRVVHSHGDSQILIEPTADRIGYNHDYQGIEKDILSILSRIHIVRPSGFSGYIATLESLRQALDVQIDTNQESPLPPVLLLFDSLISAFQLSNKMQESLPNGKGLSGMNDFLRQVKRLRAKHSSIIVSTRTTTGDIARQSRSSCEGWDKLTTHRVTLMKSVAGSPEEREGYDFVALDKHSRVFPFSVTSNGISCKIGL